MCDCMSESLYVSVCAEILSISKYIYKYNFSFFLKLGSPHSPIQPKLALTFLNNVFLFYSAHDPPFETEYPP